jgi:hypothetical protein
MFQILIKTPNGNTITNDIDQTDTIHQVKELLYLKTNIPCIYQILIYNGRILFDENSVEFYNITEGCTLYMNVRMNPIINRYRPIHSILGKRKSID